MHRNWTGICGLTHRSIVQTCKSGVLTCVHGVVQDRHAECSTQGLLKQDALYAGTQQGKKCE